MKPFKIFIGYDPREKIAFHVLSQSIIENSSIPVSISHINLKILYIKLSRGLNKYKLVYED